MISDATGASAEAGDWPPAPRAAVLPVPEVIVEEEGGHSDGPQASLGESVGLPMRLVVSPGAGRLRLLPAAQFQGGQEWVIAGQAIAEVSNGPLVHTVTAPHDARVAGVMVRDGEPVAQGQPLVWLDETARRPRDRGTKGERT
jgi:biotin carboxyl carrier protein